MNPYAVYCTDCKYFESHTNDIGSSEECNHSANTQWESTYKGTFKRHLNPPSVKNQKADCDDFTPKPVKLSLLGRIRHAGKALKEVCKEA